MSTPAATVAVRSPRQVPRAPMVVEHSAHEEARRATKRAGDLAVVWQRRTPSCRQKSLFGLILAQ